MTEIIRGFSDEVKVEKRSTGFDWHHPAIGKAITPFLYEMNREKNHLSSWYKFYTKLIDFKLFIEFYIYPVTTNSKYQNIKIVINYMLRFFLKSSSDK